MGTWNSPLYGVYENYYCNSTNSSSLEDQTMTDAQKVAKALRFESVLPLGAVAENMKVCGAYLRDMNALG